MIVLSVLIHIPLYHSDKNTIGIAGGDSYDNAMYGIDGIDLFNRESFEKTFS